MGAITQFHALGGVVGFAITTNAFNAYIRTNLASILNLPPPQLETLLQSVTTAIQALPPAMRQFVRATFASAYDLEIEILIGFAIAQALAVGLMWELKLSVADVSDGNP